jgi:hypothetical protein
MGSDTFAAIGSVPDVVPGLDFWVGARRGIGLLGFEMRADAPNTVRFKSGGQASILLLAATLDPCGYVGPFFACALGTAAWLHASGSNVRLPQSGSALDLAVGARTGVDVSLTESFAFRLRGDLLSNVLRPEVSVNGALWPLPALSAVVAVGVTYRFL